MFRSFESPEFARNYLISVDFLQAVMEVEVALFFHEQLYDETIGKSYLIKTEVYRK